ncbi:MAG TPA: hypothetical protein VGW10_10035 [Solirubrobacteraceae bacterium]|nr:hypothetical protein [Solirubrobacteraceae bacterium]
MRPLAAAVALAAALVAPAAAFAANAAPVIVGPAGDVAYAEGATPVAVAPALTLDDAENDTISGASVAITAGFSAGHDQLEFADTAQIAGAYDASTGVLTLTGAATEAQYQAALRSVRYANGSDVPSTAQRTVSFQATDAGAPAATSNVATRTVSVTAVNDAPRLDTTDAALAYIEGTGAVAVDPGLTLDDPEDHAISGGRVVIAENFNGSEDELAFVAQDGITGTYDTSTGVLTLTGTATEAQYQAALRSVTYLNGSDNPSTAERTLSFTMTDAGSPAPATSTPASRIVTVADAPTGDADQSTAPPVPPGPLPPGEVPSTTEPAIDGTLSGDPFARAIARSAKSTRGGRLRLGANVVPGVLKVVGTAKGMPALRATRQVRAGRLRIKLTPSAAAKRQLRRHGRLRIRLRVTFTPTGGTAATVTRTVTLKLSRATRAGRPSTDRRASDPGASSPARSRSAP